MKYTLLTLLTAGLVLIPNGTARCAEAKSKTPLAPATPQAKAARDRYERQKYGIFVHYVPGLTPDTVARLNK